MNKFEERTLACLPFYFWMQRNPFFLPHLFYSVCIVRRRRWNYLQGNKKIQQMIARAVR